MPDHRGDIDDENEGVRYSAGRNPQFTAITFWLLMPLSKKIDIW